MKRGAYLVGGGIASLAAAAYLIRDGGFAGRDIAVLEQGALLGGSLDGAGSPEQGYVIRGGRMFTYEAYTCTFDLLSFIPSLADPGKSVSDEIHEFNARNVSHAKARLVRDGEKIDTSRFGLGSRDRLDIIELMAVSEGWLGRRRIDEVFKAPFFNTNFWYMWATTFAFQPWHSAVEMKRYMHRFIQEVPRFNTLGGVRRTPYNQYDSIVRPLQEWLKQQGVGLELGVRVTDLDFKYGRGGKSVERLHCVRNGASDSIDIGAGDLVLVTVGSMTANSSLGSMTAPPAMAAQQTDGSWALWETLAARHHDFGRPAVFNTNVDESKWLSFTVTLRDPSLFNHMQKFTGNVAGTGGLVTFVDSNWLMSIVLPHQPHFVGQPDDVCVFWGYGLFVDQEGNFLKKKMSQCSGEEILTELLGHLHLEQQKSLILQTSICIPCLMPYITSQFMPRVKGDRPMVRPPRTSNLAFLGQFCEIPDDVVFTVEYSVRSAQTAVYSLLELDKPVEPLYRGTQDVRVLYNAFRALTH